MQSTRPYTPYSVVYIDKVLFRETQTWGVNQGVEKCVWYMQHRDPPPVTDDDDTLAVYRNEQ